MGFVRGGVVFNVISAKPRFAVTHIDVAFRYKAVAFSALLGSLQLHHALGGGRLRG
jgi:hypothetical protein